jgi:hypothetical protein
MSSPQKPPAPKGLSLIEKAKKSLKTETNSHSIPYRVITLAKSPKKSKKK